MADPFLRVVQAVLWALALTVAGPAGAQARMEAAQRVGALIEQSKAQMVSTPSAAFATAREAALASAAIRDEQSRKIAAATALWLQSEASLRLGNAPSAGPMIDRALRIISGIRAPSKLKGDLLLARGGVEVDNAKPAAALASYQEAFRIYRVVREPRAQSIALQTIATLYSDAGDLESAEKYFRQAAEVYDADPTLLISTLNNRGNVLHRGEKNAEAIRQFEEALEVSADSPLLRARIYGNLARAMISERRWADARQAIDAGIALATAQPSAAASEMPLRSIEAKLEFQLGNLQKAEQLIGRVFDGLDLEKTPLPMRDAHFTAHSIYRATGQDRLALAHLMAERRLDDEATRVAISTNAALMAARFDFANQELRIATLKAEELRRNIAFERAQARTDRILFGGLSIATLILVALLSVGLFTIRRSRNQVRDANFVLADTNAALEKALRAKTEFLATTSHEIRTPLNGILGMTQVMLADDALDHGMRDRIGVVHGAGLTMRSLVDDILDVAKMETGNMTVEMAPVDLPATLREVCRIWEEQARAKGLAFKLDLDDAPARVESDPGRLRQIVFNLLSNAIKFTSTGSVGVRAAATQGREGPMLTIAVTDSGIGIPADRQGDEIFESFRQVDAGTTRQFGGTGLGLTICRNLAGALGGTLTVASMEGSGAVFTLAIPLRAVADRTGGEGGVATGAAVGGGLVLFERNPIARAMLKSILEPRAGSVLCAATPDEAIAMLEQGNREMMLIDEATLKAVAGDPFALLADLVARADAAGSDTAILWADPDPATQDRLGDAGVGRVIPKPISGMALAELLYSDPPQRLAARGLVSQAA